MSRILVYTSPALGHLMPAMPILEELQRRGHRVALRTLAGEVEAAREKDLAAAPIAPQIEAIEHDDWRARTPIGAVRNTIDVFIERAELDAPDLELAIDEEEPDLLLVDILAFGARAAAEAWGGPWATYCPFPPPLPSGDSAPSGLGLPRARGPIGRSRDRLLNAVAGRGADRYALPRINAQRVKLGLAPMAHFWDVLLTPPLFICMTAEPFEYPRSEWPPNVVLVGPCAWDPPARLPAELEDVEEPLVLVSTSSEFQDDGRLVRTAIEGLAGEPFHVVATLPEASMEGLPKAEHATVLPFAPHGPILDRAVCAITHGGMGVTQKALSRGVPVCVVPFGRDQFDVARRVEAAGAGTRLPAQRLRPQRLRSKVREAVSMQPGAERISTAFAAAGGPGAAADALERELAG
jgi:MGT family glycosyltransferase